MPKFSAVNEVLDAKTARKKRQAFYTPLTLVERLVEWADVSPGCRTLEPSAGDGRIVHQLKAAGVESVDACEIEDGMHDRIRELGGEVVATDFLKFRPATPYHRIVMNPPFKGKQCERHIEHAWSMLAVGGKLISIAPTSLAEKLDYRKLDLPGCNHATHENIGGDWFKDFGTGVSVLVVELCREADQGVNGFRNWATFNAAVTIGSDRELLQKIRKPDGEFDPFVRTQILKEIGKYGGSCYGIDWTEVEQHVRSSESA